MLGEKSLLLFKETNKKLKTPFPFPLKASKQNKTTKILLGPTTLNQMWKYQPVSRKIQTEHGGGRRGLFSYT